MQLGCLAHFVDTGEMWRTVKITVELRQQCAVPEDYETTWWLRCF